MKAMKKPNKDARPPVPPPIWASAEATRNAIAKGEIHAPAHVKTLDPKNKVHRATLLALTDRELAALVPPTGAGDGSAPRLVSCLGEIAMQLAKAQHFEDALRLLDAATLARDHEDRALFANALWAVQNDTHGLGVMPERAHRLLERALPHGPAFPGVYFNAARVQCELGERDDAIRSVRDAVRHGFEKLHLVQNDALLMANLRGDPRFQDAFRDPALLAERAGRSAVP
jgi:hypothetical protein